MHYKSQVLPFLLDQWGGLPYKLCRPFFKGDRKNVIVRVLFEVGSQRSFITTGAVQLGGLHLARKKWIEMV